MATVTAVTCSAAFPTMGSRTRPTKVCDTCHCSQTSLIALTRNSAQTATSAVMTASLKKGIRDITSARIHLCIYEATHDWQWYLQYHGHPQRHKGNFTFIFFIPSSSCFGVWTYKTWIAAFKHAGFFGSFQELWWYLSKHIIQNGTKNYRTYKGLVCLQLEEQESSIDNQQNDGGSSGNA